jgi:hypothetical protein
MYRHAVLKFIIGLLATVLPLMAFAASDVWQDVNERSIASSGQKPARAAASYRTVRLHADAFAQILAKAPMEFSSAAKQRNVLLALPKPGGGFARFRIEESPMVSPELAAQAPGWKTYAGRGVDDPGAVLRLSWSASGLSAMIVGPDGTWYIEPYAKDDRAHYRVFHKRDAAGR